MIGSVKYNYVCLMLVMITIGLFSAPVYASDEHDGKQAEFQINHTIEFNLEDYEFKNQKGYDLILHEPATYLNVPGHPFLPVMVINVALPQGMTVSDIIPVQVVCEKLVKDFNIFPSQNPIKTGSYQTTENFVRADSQIYLSSTAYPSEPLIFIKQTDIAGAEYGGCRALSLSIPSDRKKVDFQPDD